MIEEERKKRKKDKRKSDENDLDDETWDSDKVDISRKEMGLEWMLRPKEKTEQTPAATSDEQVEEAQPAAEEIKVNPRELNPYLKNNGSGYPEDSDQRNTDQNPLLSSAVVGDGGASWRLKALKRAQEQAAREGRMLDDIVEERWGSVGQLAVSVASHKAAPARAHLRAINNRRKGLKEDEQTESDGRNQRFSKKDDSFQHAKMRVPKLHDNLSWGKRKRSTEDVSLSAAVSSINKFANDGSFLSGFTQGKSCESGGSLHSSNLKNEEVLESKVVEESLEDAKSMKPALSANQLAAKALQLRMKGLHDEAEKLMKEAENTKLKQEAVVEPKRPRADGSTSRYVMHDKSMQHKKKEEDADLHLAQTIMRNKQYGVRSQADDEYDYDDGPRRKGRKKERSNDNKSGEIKNHVNRFLLQQERCQFCFENPTRPKHLVIAIANFTYLSLPHWEPVVPGHCCILTMQHESSTRTVDDNVWDEIRNFKKCLIMMFAKQEKDLVFLETVMDLAKQRRHCMIECIPVPQKVAKQAPLYFKKAIDEAEEEWSQHNAKKLIDTSVKGLRASIPKNFPYFHVEFGLNRGFVHVIDDETEFKSSFGLNVVRGMLQLPAEDMHRRHRKHEPLEVQKLAVSNFARDWEPFDWTKQL